MYHDPSTQPPPARRETNPVSTSVRCELRRTGTRQLQEASQPHGELVPALASSPNGASSRTQHAQHERNSRPPWPAPRSWPKC